MRSAYVQQVQGMLLLAAKGTWTFADFVEALARYHTFLEFSLDPAGLPEHYAVFQPNRGVHLAEARLTLPCAELLKFTRFDAAQDARLVADRRMDDSTARKRSEFGERVYRSVLAALVYTQEQCDEADLVDYLEAIRARGIRLAFRRTLEGRASQVRFFDAIGAAAVVRTVAGSAIGLEREFLEQILGEHDHAGEFAHLAASFDRSTSRQVLPRPQ